MTTRPWETRAALPAGFAARKARMWDRWISAKSTDSSVALTTLLVRKFISCSPAQRAELRLPPPYHIREARPGECGCTRSDHSSTTPSPPRQGAGRPPPAPPLAAAEGRGPLAPDQPQHPGHPLVAEVLDVGGVRVQGIPHVLPVHRRPRA